MNISFQIKNDLAELVTLHSHLKNMQADWAISKKTAAQINLVLDELVTNIIEHGDSENEHIIEIGLTRTESEFSIVITDDGPPFDPTLRTPPDTTLPVEERQCGGLGIHLVRNLCSHCNYVRANDKNILTLKKNLQEKCS